MWLPWLKGKVGLKNEPAETTISNLVRVFVAFLYLFIFLKSVVC